MLYMYALADSSLAMFSMFLAMQYSPYRRLNAENAVSSAYHNPSLCSTSPPKLFERYG